MTSSNSNVIRLTERDCELLLTAGLCLDKGTQVKDVYCFTLYPFHDGTMLQVLRLLKEVRNAAAFAAQFRTLKDADGIENDLELNLEEVTQENEEEVGEDVESVATEVLEEEQEGKETNDNLVPRDEVPQAEPEKEDVNELEQDENKSDQVIEENHEDPSCLLRLAWQGAQVTRSHLESIWSDVLGISSLVLVFEEQRDVTKGVNPLPKRRKHDELLVDDDADLSYLTEDEEWDEEDDATGVKILTRRQRKQVQQLRKRRKLFSSIRSCGRGSSSHSWGLIPEWFA